MKFRFLAALALICVALFEISCSNNSATSDTSGTGLLYLASQGNSSLTAYGITISTGTLTGINVVATGTNPTAIAITPSLSAVFVSSTASNFVTSYSVASDGSLTVGSNTNTGTTPMGLAIDPLGQFLFVANQGSSNVSVYTINGTSLSEVPNSPFTTIVPGTTTPTGPVSLAVPPVGNYLYVANQFTNTVSVFTYDATSGALAVAGSSPYAVGTAPSGVAVSPNGSFLLVANSGSNNVGSYAICVTVSATCSAPNGSMTQVMGSPFPAGIKPVAITFEPAFNFVYVVNQQSNQIAQYSFGTGNGSMTPLSPASISTGTTPVSMAIRSGVTGIDVGNPTLNVTDYAYVANIGGTSMSIYSLSTGSGLLTVLGAPYTTPGQPSAVAAR
jgi:6-phosphogluconolactonase